MEDELAAFGTNKEMHFMTQYGVEKVKKAKKIAEATKYKGRTADRNEISQIYVTAVARPTSSVICSTPIPERSRKEAVEVELIVFDLSAQPALLVRAENQDWLNSICTSSTQMLVKADCLNCHWAAFPPTGGHGQLHKKQKEQ